jgi:glycerophosphoryl diester phosphodiesterase
VAARIAVDFDHWPYPAWVAHRGAGRLAPENTLAAFRLGAQHGYRMFECDVKLSSDGVPFLLHDDTLERTTRSAGLGGDRSWQELSALDAGGWHGQAFAGEPLPRFEDIARWALANRLLLDVEIKPSPGAEVETGRVVAAACDALWQDEEIPPLLTSFKVNSLEAARDSVAGLPRGLLVNDLWDGWLPTAQRLECVAVVLRHTLVDGPLVRQAHEARLRVGVYTPNDPDDVARVRAAGVDMVVTDAIDVHRPE